MTDFSIEAEGIGKRYFLGEGIDRNYFRLALKTVFPKSQKDRFNEFWALRDVSFSIKQGEAIGIIGRNGAGKSTLLKVISRISAPTEGSARVRGRLGTLLEVGTGFHPELTGRDNIFLSGTILGMKYSEVARKFDEIVAFSDIEKFIDTPVKRYSSGMYVRLAFAVASFLEPEILIVDEVLAVGDAAFQKKSLGRLNDASTKHGRTVLFVSHNLHAIRMFCKRVLVMEKGRLVFDGPTQQGIEHYLATVPKELDIRKTGLKDRLNRASGSARFTRVSAHNADGDAAWKFGQGEDITLRFSYEIFEPVPNLAFILGLSNALDGQAVSVIHEIVSEKPLQPGDAGIIELTLPKIALRPCELSLRADLFRADDVVGYDVVDTNAELPHLIVTSDTEDKYARQGVVSLDYRINHIERETIASPSTGQ